MTLFPEAERVEKKKEEGGRKRKEKKRNKETKFVLYKSNRFLQKSAIGADHAAVR